jgi:predicted neuraminidase
MLFHSQPIFEPGSQPFVQCHAATLVEIPFGHHVAGGDLLAAWFGGTHEGHADVAIWLARCQAGRWGAPVKIAAVPGVPLWNPVLFRDRAGTIWLFYKIGPTIPAWTGAYIRSADNGLTWSAPTHLPAGLLGPAKNKPLTLSNGDILCGASAETWQSWAAWVEISPDGGASWQRFGPIAFPGGYANSVDARQPVSAVWNAATNHLALPDSFAGVIQPTVWEYAPGRLKMLLRATRAVGFVCQSFSDDYGRTWTHPAPTPLLNPNSGIDAARLMDGRIALVYNPSQTERTPLALALSEDNGVTWPRQRLLESGPGEFSYPSIIQAEDGLIHAVYTHRRTTIQHVVLDAEWIEKKRPAFNA